MGIRCNRVYGQRWIPSSRYQVGISVWFLDFSSRAVVSAAMLFRRSWNRESKELDGLPHLVPTFGSVCGVGLASLTDFVLSRLMIFFSEKHRRTLLGSTWYIKRDCHHWVHKLGFRTTGSLAIQMHIYEKTLG